MALGNPKFLGVQGVLGLSVLGRDQARDEQFIAAVRPEFENLQNRQVVGLDAPPQVPHLILASQSSQLSLSAAQAEFQVQFFGEYVDDVERALAYVERKLLAVFNGLETVGAGSTAIGIVAKFHFPDQTGDPQTAPIHVLNTLTKTEIPSEDLEDASVKVAVRVRDTYFVHLAVSNYEMRQFEQAMRPGMQNLQIKPWTGTVTETGVDLTVDINNRLEARIKREDPKVTAEGVSAVIGLLSDVATNSGPKFAETGDVGLSDIVASSETGAS